MFYDQTYGSGCSISDSSGASIIAVLGEICTFVPLFTRHFFWGMIFTRGITDCCLCENIAVSLYVFAMWHLSNMYNSLVQILKFSWCSSGSLSVNRCLPYFAYHLEQIVQLSPWLKFWSWVMVGINLDKWRSGPCRNIKTVFPRCGDSHVKDKMVARPSYV